jgi:hypothetical protein
MRRVLAFVVKIVVVLAVIAVGLELGLRFLEPRHDGIRKLLYLPELEERYDSVDQLEELLGRSMLGFVPRTNYSGFVLNSKSLHTEEYTEEKPPGVERTVILGDSFGFCSGGMPYSDHWVTLLEAGLKERTGRAIEVINLSVPAVGPRFERRMWEIEGSKLGADRAVLALFIGNDLTTEQGAAAVGHVRAGFMPWLVLSSHLARAVRNLWKSRGAAPEVVEERKPPKTHEKGGFELENYRQMFDDTKPVFEADAYVRIEANAMNFFLKEGQDRFDDLIDDVCETIEALRDDVREHGAELSLLLIPAAFQVQEDVRQAVLDFTKRPPDAYDLDYAQARLREFCAREGIDCLDPLEQFREAARDKRLYRVRDTHWNKEGNRLAARLLADHLAAQ